MKDVLKSIILSKKDKEEFIKVMNSIEDGIDFYINDVKYSCKQNMTWGEFISSIYNIYGFYLDASSPKQVKLLKHEDAIYKLVNSEKVYVSETDLIEPIKYN